MDRLAKQKNQPAAPDSGAVLEVGGRGLLVGLLVLALLALGAWWLLGRGAATTVVPNPTAAASTLYGAQPTWTTPEGDPGLGPQNAPVTIVAYSDYQCPNCRQFAVEVLPWLATTWMPTGLVRVVFRDFPIRGPESNRAAEAARCAGEQGAYWRYHELLFEHQSGENKGTFGDEPLKALAALAGLDEAGFSACLASGRSRPTIEAVAASARQQGFDGTPAYVINGRSTSGAIPVERWNELLALYAQEFGTLPPVPTGAVP
jgi:protein-disulfide isomerase